MRILLAASALAVGTHCAQAKDPLPFDIGGSFELVDQYGQTRTEADPDGNPQLLFFGYANCPNICSAAMPAMAEVVDNLAAEGIGVTPVMVTVSPERDQVDTMGPPLAALHPAFIGLTGDTAALDRAYKAFSVDVKPLFQDPEYGWIYAHGSFIHLLDGEGETLTLFPPVLDSGQMTSIALRYLTQDGG